MYYFVFEPSFYRLHFAIEVRDISNPNSLLLVLDLVV